MVARDGGGGRHSSRQRCRAAVAVTVLVRVVVDGIARGLREQAGVRGNARVLLGDAGATWPWCIRVTIVVGGGVHVLVFLRWLSRMLWPPLGLVGGAPRGHCTWLVWRFGQVGVLGGAGRCVGGWIDGWVGGRVGGWYIAVRGRAGVGVGGWLAGSLRRWKP